MINISIPSENVILNALNHEIRREILRLLEKRPMSYSKLMEYFTITSGKLNYHLKLLTGFVEKKDDGTYINTKLGKRIFKILDDFRGSIQDDERHLLKKAYMTQLKEEKSYLHLRLIGGLQMKIIAISAIVALIIIMLILYVQVGVNIIIFWPLIFILVPSTVIGIIWIYRMYGPAKKFVKQVEKVLNEEE